MQEYDGQHPFAGLAGSDNVFAFHTQRYSAQPLVIQGPGAGAAVTAAGVFADILHVAERCSGHEHWDLAPKHVS